MQREVRGSTQASSAFQSPQKGYAYGMGMEGKESRGYGMSREWGVWIGGGRSMEGGSE